MPGRLNRFQQSMLQWDELHPYSAIHAVRMRGALQIDRLRNCINTTVARRGLARLTLDRRRRTFQFETGPADCEIRVITGPDGPRSMLAAEMERQLNTRFDHSRPFCPFRFVLVPAGEAFFLGLVYFHPVADAESVVHLLKDIVTDYLEEGTGRVADPLELYPEGRASLWHHPGVVARKLLELPAQMRRLRQSYRASYHDLDNPTNGYVCFSLATEDWRSLVAAAKSWGVTVNDLCLALLMKSVAPCTAACPQTGRRRKLSVGCIVNLRPDLGLDGRRVFGLFLGSFTVTHAVPPDISLRELAGGVRQQTARIKRHRLYLGTPLELGLARWLRRLFSPGRPQRFYAKHYPLWGGITNMNLNPLWGPGGRHAPSHYFRAVSTGPVTPLVLSVTTVGDRASVGLSYRTAVFSRQGIENLQDRFRKHLEETRSHA